MILNTIFLLCPTQDVKLTTTGKNPDTYNGVPDWVFEEEVFEDNKALWWSPEGTKLVWGFFNDTQLDSYVLPNYKAGDWDEDMKQYPEYTKLPYPKVNKGGKIKALHTSRLK